MRRFTFLCLELWDEALDNFPRCQPSKVQVYPGGWVHSLKAFGLSPTKAPNGAKENWIVKQMWKLSATIHYLLENIPHNVGGIRIDFRCVVRVSDSKRQKYQLEAVCHIVVQRLLVVSLQTANILSHALDGCN